MSEILPLDVVKSIRALLKRENKFVICSHFHPDPDAYGSMGAFGLALQAGGKEIVFYNESGQIDRYSYIPAIQLITTKLPNDLKEWTLITCDCGDNKRVGDKTMPLLAEFKEVLNIDHHVTNNLFGDINLVVKTASSTCEIIYDLMEALKLPVTIEIAKAIYIGIMSDTGSFRYSSTTEHTLDIIKKLIVMGVSPEEISFQLYGNVPLASLQLQSGAIQNMKLEFNNKFAYTVISKKMFDHFKAESEDTEGIVELLRDILGVEVAASIREYDGYWKISLRSINPAVSVGKLAEEFGGGGHVQAAGFRWRKDLPSLVQNLTEKVSTLLKS